MKLRLFLILALGACAHPASMVSTPAEVRADLSPIGASAHLVMVSDVQPATPSAPVPYTVLNPGSTGGDAQALQAWRAGFIQRAVADKVKDVGRLAQGRLQGLVGGSAGDQLDGRAVGHGLQVVPLACAVQRRRSRRPPSMPRFPMVRPAWVAPT